MLVTITGVDAARTSTLYDPDGIAPVAILGGAQVNLLFMATDDATDLFDLSEPPSFAGPHMVWSRLDERGALALFLSSSTGDEIYPFARLDGFADALSAGSGSGSGDLTRPNTVVPPIGWSLAP